MLIEALATTSMWAVLAATLYGIVRGLVDTRRVVGPPFLFSVGMLLIVCPQLAVILLNRSRVPDDALVIFCVMVLAGGIAFALGSRGIGRAGGAPRDYPVVTWKIDDRKLLRFGLVVSGVGTVGYALAFSGGEFGYVTGWQVYWITLSRVTSVGLTLLSVALVLRFTFVRLLCVAVFCIYPIASALIFGRRSMALELPLILFGPLLIMRPAIRIPRGAVVLALALFFVVAYAIPYWRAEFSDGRHLDAIMELPLSEIVSGIFSGGNNKTLEVAEGALVAGADWHLGTYEWGLRTLYNGLVEAYVPGTLLGRDAKYALFWGEPSNFDAARNYYGLPINDYTAKTGFTDLFRQFSFGGVFVIFLVSRVFRRWITSYRVYGDERTLLAWCVFIAIPAGIPYGPIFSDLPRLLPDILVLLLAIKYSVHRGAALRQPSAGTRGNSYMMRQA